MDRNMDFNGYDNMNFDPNMLNDGLYRDPMFNPMLQYEQAYMYYRYLTMQMEYKIKCKEYEKMTSKDRSTCRINSNIYLILFYCVIFNIVFSPKHLIR